MKMKAKIDRMVNSGNVKAIASVSLDRMFVVKNLKIMDGRKGLFVSMPQETYSGKDGQKKYSNLFFRSDQLREAGAAGDGFAGIPAADRSQLYTKAEL